MKGSSSIFVHMASLLVLLHIVQADDAISAHPDFHVILQPPYFRNHTIPILMTNRMSDKVEVQIIDKLINKAVFDVEPHYRMLDPYGSEYFYLRIYDDRDFRPRRFIVQWKSIHSNISRRKIFRFKYPGNVPRKFQMIPHHG
ncbi:unnamed protein product [Auanema sp. JU1783]|nr:unnamed protein product [Auanema sp. JU1783]